MLLFRLSDVPPGVQHDQVFNIVDAIELLYGRYRIYFTANFGREPLFIYSAAALFRLANGDFIWGLRLTGAVWALLGAATSISLARRKLPDWAALVAVLLMAGSFWFLFTGRVGLRAISAMTLGAAMLYWLDRALAGRAWARRSLPAFALSGLFGGLAVYTYLSARALLALPPLLLLFELVAGGVRRIQPQRTPRAQRADRDREESISLEGPLLPLRPLWHKLAGGLLLSWLVMLAVSAPLLLWLRANPGAERRVGELTGPLGQAAQGDLLPLLRTVGEGIATLLWRDASGLLYQYNLPGRPALMPLLAVLFVIGLAASRRRVLSSRRERLWLSALALGLGPALITPGGPLYLRAIVAMPLVFVYVAAGLQTVWHLIRRIEERRRAGEDWPTSSRNAVASLFVIGLVLVHIAETANAYFVRWPSPPEIPHTPIIYNADLRDAAAYSAEVPPEQPLYISTDFWLDLDQQTYLLYRPARADVGWFKGGLGLPVPPPDRPATYIWTVSAESNRNSAMLLVYEKAKPLRQWLRVATLERATVDTILGSAGVLALPTPLRYGDRLELAAAGTVPWGDGVDVLTRWRVLQPWGQNLPPKIAAKLVDETGRSWTQADDMFAVAYQGWQPGQEFVQVTHLALPQEAHSSSYSVLVSVYDDQNGALTVFKNQQQLPTVSPSIGVSISVQAPSP